MTREEEVDGWLKALPVKKAIRYCQGGRGQGCACMGCVDHTMHEHNISEAEWVYWKKVNREYIREQGMKEQEKEMEQYAGQRYFKDGVWSVWPGREKVEVKEIPKPETTFIDSEWIIKTRELHSRGKYD